MQKIEKNNQRKHFLFQNFHSFEKKKFHGFSFQSFRSFALFNEKIQFESDLQRRSDEFLFFNYAFDKSRLKNIVSWFFDKHGHYKTLKFLEKLKEFGFGFATTAGLSLGIDDLKIPNQKIALLASAETKVAKDFFDYRNGKITGIEKVQRFIYTWNQTNDTLKQEVVKHFEKTDLLNPIYMMAFSGARGNMSQVRQLVGMRGLMSDPQGQIIDFPIQSNFREGLTLTEYLISTYGARKGIVDTALRTATAGYLTRRLVDVAQHTIVSHFDCGTMRGIFLFDMKDGKKTIYSFQNRLIGRVLGQNIEFPGVEVGKNLGFSVSKTQIAFRNQEIDSKLAKAIANVTKKAFVRSPLTCETSRFVCQLCYGWSFSHGKLVSVGEAVGIIAAQSIGEPGTQLTMRTFHTGGVFAGGLTDQILAPFPGKIQYFQSIPGSCVRISLSEIAFFTKMPGSFLLQKNDTFGIQSELSDLVSSATTNEKFLKFLQKFQHQKKQFQFSEVFRIPAYALLFCRQNEFVEKKQVLAQFSSVLQKVQYGSAEQTLFSTFAGEFVFGKSFLKQNKKYFLSDFPVQKSLAFQTDSAQNSFAKKQNFLFEKRNGDFSELELKSDNLWKSQNWTTIWILSGKIFYNWFDTKFWIEEGDLLKKSSVVRRILWKKKQNFQYSFISTKKNSLFSEFFQESGQEKQKEKTLLYFLTFENSAKFCSSFFSFQPFFQRKSSKFDMNSSLFFFFEKPKQSQKMFSQSSKKFLKIVQKKHLFKPSFEFKKQKFKPHFPRKKIPKEQRLKYRFSPKGFFETKKVFSFFSEIPTKNEKFNDIVFFQNKSNRFFRNFQKIQYSLQKSKNFSQNKKTQNFFQSFQTSKNQSILFSKNVLNSIFLKFAKKKKNEIFSSLLKNLKYSNVFQNSQKFGFFSFFFEEKLFFKKESRKFFQQNTFQTFRKVSGIQTKKHTKNFHEIVSIQTFKKQAFCFAFPKFQKNMKLISQIFNKKEKFQDFRNFSLKMKVSLNKYSQKLSSSYFKDLKKLEPIFQNVLLKKILFRISVEKIRYQKFGYVSSLFDIVQNQIFQNSFQTFTTFQQDERGFHQNIHPGKTEKQFVFPHENFFGKEFPNFFSYSFFQNFQTKTSGLFYIVSFQNFLKYQPVQNFVSFHFFQNFLFQSFQIPFFKTEFCTLQSIKQGQRELQMTYRKTPYFKNILSFQKIKLEFFEKFNESKRVKFFFFSSIQKIFPVRIDTFSFLSIAIFAYFKYIYLFNEEKISNISFSNLTHFFHIQKNSNQFFTIQKPKFQAPNFQKLFQSFLFIQNRKSFFLSNFSSNFFKSSFVNFQNIQEKQTNVFSFQFYNQEVFWLPQENFFLSTTEVSFCPNKNERMFFFSKKTPILYFVNRQGKKQKIFFAFHGFGKFSNLQNSENSFRKFILRKQFLTTEQKKQIHKNQNCNKIQQKLSFSKKRKNKLLSFQKNVSFFLKKRISNEKFENIQKLFEERNTSLSSRDSLKILFGMKKTESKKSTLKIQKYRTKRFLFSKIQTNQLFTCLPLQHNSHSHPKMKNLKSSLFQKKVHLKIQSGWLSIPFLSSFLFDLHQTVLKNGSFFGNSLSFEQNSIFSETVVLSFPFSKSGYFQNSKQVFQKNFKKKTNEQICFSVKSFQKNKKCRYSSSLNFFEKMLTLESSSKVRVGQKKKLFQFFQPFEYQLFENQKNGKKLFQNLQIQSFSMFFSSNSYSELYKKYHSIVFNSDPFQTKNKILTNQSLKNSLNDEMEFVSNFENFYFSQNEFSDEPLFSFQLKKNFVSKNFLGNIGSFQNFDFQRQIIQQKNLKKILEQKKKKNISKKSLYFKEKNKLFSNFFQKTFLNFELMENGKMFNSFGIHKNGQNCVPRISFYPLQFLPFRVSFSKEQVQNADSSKMFFDNSLKTRAFPVFSKNALKNTIEFCVYEKKAPFLDQKFLMFSFFENFFKFSSFWLNKEKMNFVFPFEKFHTNFRNISQFHSYFEKKNEKKYRNFQTNIFQHSILKNSQKYCGSTKILSPYKGEILSMVTHEMNWWEKASKISTLQKCEKLFTILTKKDLFAVKFPLKNQNIKNKQFQNFSNSKQKNYFKLYEIVLSSHKLNFQNSETNDLSFQKTMISSFLTKYEKKIYSFQNLRIGYPSLSKIPRVGNFVSYGDCFFDSALRKPGQILHFNSKRMTCRFGQPFLVSQNGILHFSKIPYIQKNVPVVTLPYQTLQAGDIVQGIPKVEQFFEARTTIQGRLFVSSLPILLKGIFERYKVFLPLEQATRQSFLKIQQIIVDGVQRVYRSQGVSITDKHLEIVVRQMTTKVQILHGAQTGFFPGELVNLDLVERLNKFFMVKIRYEPVILGITRSSLEVESFLSASSFQQTTKILSLAAISQKKDFLKGLKENLLVGNLIPAGTGYFRLTKNQ